VITLRAVGESKDPHPRPVDYLGLGTFSLGLAALVFGLIRSNEDGWGSATVTGSLGAAAVLLIAFVAAEALQKQPMFDLSLFRKPAFVGGLIAAFAISASLFSLFPYLVIYMQAGLGLSAIEIGVRFLVLSGPIFITAAIAGRLTEKVPARFLIGPGFLCVGIAQLLMRGLEPGGDWTHFIPGFVLAGVGAGFINVPLASTAVGVVEPARAGMASGINSTFRQIGIATGVAALGAIFSHHVTDARQPVAGFVDGLNAIILVGAVLALAAAATSLTLIRSRDFVQSVPAPAQ
jgi:predicted MFS family arabinose efflux permease